MEERQKFQGFIQPPNNRGGHLCSWQLGAKLPSGNWMILPHQQKEVGENRRQSTASPQQVAEDTCSNPTSHHWSARPGSWKSSSNPSPASLVMSPHESSGFRSLAWDRRDFSLLPDSLSSSSVYSSARSVSHTCSLPLSTPISVITALFPAQPQDLHQWRSSGSKSVSYNIWLSKKREQTIDPRNDLDESPG